jgi:hypothetical protein
VIFVTVWLAVMSGLVVARKFYEARLVPKASLPADVLRAMKCLVEKRKCSEPNCNEPGRNEKCEINNATTRATCGVKMTAA